jgi:hypothetical protein
MTMLNAIDRLDAEIQTALGFELFWNLCLEISLWQSLFEMLSL